MSDNSQTLSIELSGGQAGDPEFSLYVNGNLVSSDDVVTAQFCSGQWQTFNFDYSGSTPVTSIAIEFTNDQSGSGGNLFIGDVTLDGATATAALADDAYAVNDVDDITAAALFPSQSLTLTSSMFHTGTPGTLEYLGVNFNGADYTDAQLAQFNTSVEMPGLNDLEYYAAKGLNIVRLNLLWEQLQPTAGGPLNQTYLNQIETVIANAKSLGLTVDIDIHNFGAAYGGFVGESATTNDDFANLWGQIASALKGDSNVMFGLMNEPYAQTAEQWLTSTNAAIAAIRAAGADTQTILVSGTDFDNASAWITSGNAAVFGTGVVDPDNNYAFEVHQYFDAYGTGLTAPVVSSDIGVERLEAVTNWAETYGAKLFLGEFGVDDDATSLSALSNTLAYMADHSDVWLGGTYYDVNSTSYFSADPNGLTESAQMDVLQSYAPGTQESADGYQPTSYTNNNVTTYANGEVETQTFTPDGVTLLTDKIVNPDGSMQISSYQITGRPYVTDVDQYNSAGVETSIVQTQANGNLWVTIDDNVSTGERTSDQYSASGVLSSATINYANGGVEYQTYGGTGALDEDVQVNPDGSKTVWAYNIAGQNYTEEEDTYNSAGQEVSIVQKNATGVTVWSDAYNPTTGTTTYTAYCADGAQNCVQIIYANQQTQTLNYASDGETVVGDTWTYSNGKISSIYSYNCATGTAQTNNYSIHGQLQSVTFSYSDGSSEDLTYGAGGTEIDQIVLNHADGSEDVYSYYIKNESYRTEHDSYNSSGIETEVQQYYGNGQLACEWVYNKASSASTTYEWSRAGLLTQVVIAYGDTPFEGMSSTTSAPALVDPQTNVGGAMEVFNYNIKGQKFYESEQIFAANGDLASVNLWNNNGSHTQTAYQSGVTLQATVGTTDTFVGSADGGDTFELVSGLGEDVVKKFDAGAASGHDILLLSGGANGSYASLLAAGDIQSTSAGALITLGSDYSVLLQGVATSKLSAADFSFT